MKKIIIIILLIGFSLSTGRANACDCFAWLRPSKTDDISMTINPYKLSGKDNLEVVLYTQDKRRIGSADSELLSCDTAHIGNVEIAPNYQNKGYGTKIVGALIKELSTRYPVTTITLTAEPYIIENNRKITYEEHSKEGKRALKRLIKFYKKFNFQVIDSCEDGMSASLALTLQPTHLASDEKKSSLPDVLLV